MDAGAAFDHRAADPVASEDGRLLTFSIPLDHGVVERAEGLAFCISSSRAVPRCTVQVIVECDHHGSFARDYGSAVLPQGDRLFYAPFRDAAEGPGAGESGGAAGYWAAVDHDGVWTAWNTVGMRRLQVKVFAPEPIGANLRLAYGWRLVAADAPLRLLWARPLADPLPLGRRFELAFDVGGWQGNPFDPDDLSIRMEVQPPGGAAKEVGAFLYENFAALSGEPVERIVPKGPKHWRARFRPVEQGVHRYRLSAVAAGRPAAALTEGSFTVGPGRAPDFLRVSPRTPRYFEHADGRTFYPIGWSIAYPNDQPYGLDYVNYLPGDNSLWFTRKLMDDLADSGGNLFRLWLADWSTGLEWNEGVDNYGGIGRYNLKNAWLVDRILDRCEERGLFVMLETLNHVQLAGAYGLPQNPYFRPNGGFLDEPVDYWRSPLPLKPCQQRLRYLLARFSDSPAIHSWQYISEIDQVTGTMPGGPDGWPYARRRLLQYLRFIKQNDPYGHVVTNHMCQPTFDPSFFDEPEAEFVHTNAYPTFCGLPDDQIDALRTVAQWYADRRKPVLFGEYGGNWQGDPAFKMERDTIGGLWAGIASRLSGAPMSWWWNFNYGDDLGPLYRVAADFMAGEDLIGEDVPELGGWLHRAVGVRSKDGNARALMVGNRRRRYMFLYNFDTICRTRAAAPDCADVEASFADMADGDYAAEYWNLRTGRTGRMGLVAVRQGAAVLRPPDFAEGWAVKIRPAPPAAPKAEAPAASDLPARASTAGAGDGALWQWRLRPVAPVVNEMAANSTVYGAFVGLPASCRGAFPRLTDEAGGDVAFAWRFLGDGAGWQIRVPGAQRGPFVLSCSASPVTAEAQFDERAIGLQAFVVQDCRTPLRDEASFEDALRAAAGGRTVRLDEINQLENPAGANEYFAARYSGPLLAPRDGRYELAINADDGGFLKLDGRTIVSWPGPHPPDAGYRPLKDHWTHRAGVQLARGVHWVEFYHQNLAGYRVAKLGWQPAGLAGAAEPGDPFFHYCMPGSDGWQVVPVHFLSGRIPCEVDVLRNGAPVATIAPCSGLLLRRPHKRLFAACVQPAGGAPGRTLFFDRDGLFDLAGACGMPGEMPVWVSNAAMRPFSIEWRQGDTRDGRRVLNTVCYDAAVELSLMVGDRVAGARTHKPGLWVSWPLKASDAGGRFTITLGGVELDAGLIESWPAADASPLKLARHGRTRRLIEVGGARAAASLPAEACRAWYGGPVEGGRVAAAHEAFDPWREDPAALAVRLPEPSEAAVLVVLDRAAMLEGLSPQDVLARTHALIRAVAGSGALPVLAIGADMDLAAPVQRRYAEQFVGLARQWGCPLVDLRRAGP